MTMPPTWSSGIQLMDTSSDVNWQKTAVLAAQESRLRWVWRTALGRPVLPEVSKSSARSSGWLWMPNGRRGMGAQGFRGFDPETVEGFAFGEGPQSRSQA